MAVRVHRLPGKTMRQNTTTREKLPQADAAALLREPSAPGTAGRQRPKRKRNVMPRRKRQVWTAGRPESPCGTPWTAPGGRRSPAAAPAPAPAYSPLDSAPARPDAGRDAGMMTARHHGSVPESLIPAAPQGELPERVNTPEGGPTEPCLHSPGAAPGFSECRARTESHAKAFL